MTLILRKCPRNGISRNKFKYGKVGERVTAPDWNPNPICGNGLHGLKEGIGNWALLEGKDWLVIDADDQIVDIDKDKCKFNTGVILFRGPAIKLSKTDFCHEMAKDSYSAYQWAWDIGNRNVMIDRIVDCNWAYYWATKFGNRNIMKSKVTGEYWIDCWNLAFPFDRIEIII